MLLYSSSEIPQFRLPYDVVSYEVALMQDLGVQVSVMSKQMDFSYSNITIIKFN